MNKSEVIHIRASEVDKALIRALAKASGQSVSKFMLKASTAIQLRPILDYDRLKENIRDR